MPTQTKLSHANRYQSYLLDLRKNWAYTRTNRMPGKNQLEKKMKSEFTKDDDEPSPHSLLKLIFEINFFPIESLMSLDR